MAERQWRIRFDEPISLATEPGYIRSMHSSDFAATEAAYSGTWRDPVTRLVQLAPNWLTRDYSAGMQALTTWQRKPACWQAIVRGPQAADWMTTMQASGWAAADIDLGLPIGRVIELDSTPDYDTLTWALQSSGWALGADEAFCLHTQVLADEQARQANWLAVQWADLYVHLSLSGWCRVYRYADRSDLASVPVLVDEFEFASPGEIAHSHGYFAFHPVPGFGLALHFSAQTPERPVTTSNARSGVERGHLLQVQSRWTGAHWTLCDASPVRIAVNPYLQMALGFQRVRYPASGTYTDGAFAPLCTPTTVPDSVTPHVAYTAAQTITCELRNAGDTGAWTITDRQARVRATLTAADRSVTPYLAGYEVDWQPAYATRATTPYTPSKVFGLEWTRSETGRIEGRCECLMAGAGVLIAERGDATFVVEYSDNGSTWVTEWGGFASEPSLESVIDGMDGFHYRAGWTLSDMWQRLGETHVAMEAAFDGRLLGDAINLVLRGGGFAPISPLPAALQSLVIPRPSDARGWRYSPQAGDDGTKALEALLLLARSQHVEWRVQYDWATAAWTAVQRARDTSGATRWILSPLRDDADHTGLVASYDRYTPRSQPPEGNIVIAQGLSRDDSYGLRFVAQPLYNQESLTDPTSLDYLGRAVIVRGTLAEAPTQDEVNRFARRLYDAMAHGRVTATVASPEHVPILPDAPVQVQDADGVAVFDGWCKRVTVRVEPGGLASTEMQIDTTWEGDLDA